MPQPKWPAEDMLGPVIDALPEPVFVIDAETHALAFNAAAQALAPALRVGEPLSRSLRSPDMLDAAMRVAAGGEAEKAAWTERLPVERWFEAHIAPVRFEGFRTAAMISLRDLTEAHRVERMRVDFVANASHELRTPLASLLGFVETLQGPAKNDAAARERFLGIMREQAQRMARLIDDLLSLSRIEQHMHVRPVEAVDFTVLVAHIVDTLTPMAEENGVPLALDLEQNVIAPGDRDELARIVENLIENALKYGACENEPRPVEISLARQGERRFFRARPRAGHRARASAAPHRTLLPGRRRQEPRQGRHGARARHRQTYRAAPSRAAVRRVHARGGGAFPRHPAGVREPDGENPIKTLIFIRIDCHISEMRVSQNSLARPLEPRP
ncbi:sensor histidine kinase [Methylocystis sp. IM2]|uniref:sensor histidine kinase n=1 Tax=Methylocystis sp. IM2 TaxID=3136563 RepID=UPI0040482B96